VPLFITLTTGDEYQVSVPPETESESATEIREGKTGWIEVGRQVWVRRESIIKVEIRGGRKSAGFS
jgi:hypothetical protein